MKRLIFIFLTIFAFSWQSQAQWTENFEGSNTDLPAGWTTINGGDDHEWGITSDPGISHSGNNVASIFYTSDAAHDDYLIMPAITVQNGVNDQISFWIKQRGDYGETYEVRLSTTVNNDATAFDIILQSETTAQMSWEQKEFSLSNYEGQTVYVAIRATKKDGYYLYVDDVENYANNPCQKPTDLSASDITVSSANLSWFDNNYGDVVGFVIEYGEEGFESGTGTQVNVVVDPEMLSDDNIFNYTLTGLDVSTTYDWYVSAKCSEESQSYWSDVNTFTTECGIVTGLPFTEDFSAGVMPNCWTQEYVEADKDWTVNSFSFAAVFMGFTSDIGKVTKLVLPGMNLSGLENPVLTYKHNQKLYSGVYQDELRVYYKTSEEGEWMLIPGQEFTENIPEYVTEENVVLPNPSSTYYIAFEATCGNGFGVYVDDIEVKEEGVVEPVPVIAVNPENHDFGEVELGQSVTQTFTVTNEGTATLTVSAITLSGDAAFTTNGMATEVAPNGNYTFDVVFMPTVAGVISATVTIENNSENSMVMVSVTGEGKEALVCDPITEFPFTEDFSGNSMPDCWTQEYVNKTLDWSFGYEQAYLEANAVTTGSVTKLILPPLDLSGITNPTLTYDHKQELYSPDQDELRVYYKTSEGGEWMLIPGQEFTENIPVYVTEEVVLPNPSSTYYIAFEGYANYGYGVYLDNIKVEEGVVEPVPVIAVNPENHDFGEVELGQSVTQTFTVTNEGTATLTISAITLSGDAAFTTNGMATSVAPNGNYTFDVVFMPTAVGIVSATVTIENNSATPTVMVSVTGEGKEAASGCDAIIEFPFTEDFSGEVIPDCWTQEYVGTSDLDWKINSYDHSAEFTSNNQDDTGKVTKLVLPEMNLSNVTNPVLTYNHKQSLLYGAQDELRVYYKTSEAGEWILLQEFTDNIPAYVMEEIALPNPSSSYFIAFEGTNNYGLGVRVDDVEVKEGDIVVVPEVAVWQGQESDDWFTAANWDVNAVPGEITAVTIPANAEQYPTISEEAMEIGGIDGAICKNITFEQGATLLGFEMLMVVENATFHQFLTGGENAPEKDSPNAIYHHVSSPVANPNAGDIFPLSAYLRQYNETTQMWENLLAADGMEVGKGYNLWMPEGDENITYQGALNQEAIGFDGLTLTGAVNNYSGWHLLGNPYPAAIDVNALTFPAEMQHSVSVWSNENGTYLTSNGTAGSLADNALPVAQGFFVKVNENNVNFTISPEACVHNSTSAYKGDSKLIAINVKNNANQYNETAFVTFSEDGDNGYDVFDVVKLDGLNAAPALYTMIDDMRININSRYSADKMPLYFNTNVDGSFTLKVTDLNLRGEATIEDTFTGAMIPATADATYEFTANADDDMARFVVHFKGFTNVEDEDLNINVYADRQQVVVNNQTSEEAVIMLYNMAGQLIEAVRTMDVETRINVEVKGAYFVTVKNSKAVQTEKVIIK